MKICQCSKIKLYSHSDKVLDHRQIAALENFIAHRQNYLPMAHIIGYKEFWSLDFKVSLATLIPRPATECLVAYILEHKSHHPLKVLDLGTGTGAIAISIAKERPSWEITAVDLNPSALSMARQNAIAHHCKNIKFLQSNWFSRLVGMNFDVIISNPPYIAKNDVHLLQGDIQHEPRLALVSEDEGYFDLNLLIAHSKKHLDAQGMLLLEHGSQQQDKILQRMTASGFNHVEGHLDLDHLPRFCVAY
jgi:release factor glutamine methyltransferase